MCPHVMTKVVFEAGSISSREVNKHLKHQTVSILKTGKIPDTMVQLSLTAGDGYLHPRYEEPKNESVVHACKPFEQSVRAKQRYHELVKATVPRAVPQLGLRASLSTGKHASTGSLLIGAFPRTGGRARYHLQRKRLQNNASPKKTDP